VKTFRRRRGARKPLGTTSNFDELLKQRDREVEVWEEEVREAWEDQEPPSVSPAHGTTPVTAGAGRTGATPPSNNGPERAGSTAVEIVGGAGPGWTDQKFEFEFKAPGPFGPTGMVLYPQQLTPAQVLEHFYAGLAPLSKKAYQQDMAALAGFCGLTPPALVQELLNLSQALVNGLAARWLDSMAGLSPATRARRLVTLRSFGRAARAAGLVTWTLELKGPKVQPYRDTRGVPEDGVRKMFAAAGEGLEGARNRVILFLLAVLGLRRHEVAGLNTNDFDVDGKRLRVLGKRGVEKFLHLPQPVARALKEWETERWKMQMAKQIEHWTEDLDVPLICSLAEQNYGGRLTGAGVNHIVHQIAERAGVKAWSNALRHSVVTVALDKGHHMHNVKPLMRHENFETTVMYDDNSHERSTNQAIVSDGLAELYDEKGSSQ
jgi:site-specific recombinase XerD